MFNMVKRAGDIYFLISSESHQIERVLDETNKFLFLNDRYCSPILTMVQRELLVNAIKHGNKNRVEQTVQCIIRLIDDRMVEIEVEDAGAGFDYRNIEFSFLFDPEFLDPNNYTPCGFQLITAFSNSVKFNEKGNRITVVLDIEIEKLKSTSSV